MITEKELTKAIIHLEKARAIIEKNTLVYDMVIPHSLRALSAINRAINETIHVEVRES